MVLPLQICRTESCIGRLRLAGTMCSSHVNPDGDEDDGRRYGRATVRPTSLLTGTMAPAIISQCSRNWSPDAGQRRATSWQAGIDRVYPAAPRKSSTIPGSPTRAGQLRHLRLARPARQGHLCPLRGRGDRGHRELYQDLDRDRNCGRCLGVDSFAEAQTAEAASSASTTVSAASSWRRRGQRAAAGRVHRSLCRRVHHRRPFGVGPRTGAAFSINLTPSHNPLEYGGYKYNAADAGPAATILTERITANARR